MRTIPALIAASLLTVAPACDRRLEPWVPPEEEPAPSDRPLRVPGLQTPEPRAAAAPPAAGPAGPPIRGRVLLAQGVQPPQGGVLFVIARSQAGGPPLAVRRLPPGPFPLEFEIGPGDAMIAGRPFSGPIRLSARLDADGDPLTRAPGDLAAGPIGPLAPGRSGVELRLAGTSPAP